MNALKTRKFRAGATAILLTTFALSALASSPPMAEAKKTYFTGEEIGVSQVPGRLFLHGSDIFMLDRQLVAEEVISDPRLAGTGTFNYTVAANLASWTGAYWGSARIVPHIGGGEWNGHWVAAMTPEGTTIQLTVVGSGDFSGLVARLTYTSGPGNLQIAGYIVEAEGGPADRPFKVSACRTERIEYLNCQVLDPMTWMPLDPPEAATILRAKVVSELGQTTHAGQMSNEGLAVVDPVTGAVTGTGIATAANGDRLSWVYSGAIDQSGLAQGSVDFCGGTGRFDPAVGGFDLEVQQVLEPTDEEGVFMADYCYGSRGTIRY